MGKRIAIITGASGGIGREFVKLMLKEEIDEIWAIARSLEKLEVLKAEFGEKIIAMSKDLSKSEELLAVDKLLKIHNPIILYLINNAGLAKMGAYNDFSINEIEDTIHINCSAPVILSNMCIPYMVKDSRILNISSASSFQPLPYLNLYAATKVFEKAYSRALNIELIGTGITSTAVCPSWVDTDLLLKESNGIKIKFDGIISPDMVAVKAMKDAKKGRDMSVCTLYVKYMHLLAKLFPQKLVMRMWVHKIKKYIVVKKGLKYDNLNIPIKNK